jgi:hypothetical protein
LLILYFIKQRVFLSGVSVGVELSGVKREFSGVGREFRWVWSGRGNARRALGG